MVSIPASQTENIFTKGPEDPLGHKGLGMGLKEGETEGMKTALPKFTFVEGTQDFTMGIFLLNILAREAREGHVSGDFLS